MDKNIETPFQNEHAQAVAALLRLTVCNPTAPTMRIDYTAWHRIQRMLYSKPYMIAESQAQTLVDAFTTLLATIQAETGMRLSDDDLNWLAERIQEQDITTIMMFMVMTTSTPQGDLVSLNEAAEIIGHSDASNLRRWISEGRYLSAQKPGGRDWLLSRSELKLRNRA